MWDSRPQDQNKKGRAMESDPIARKVLSAAALMLALTLPTVGQDIPNDESGFTEYVAGRLRSAVGESTVAVQGPLTLKLGGLQANLDRIFAFCSQNASACPTEISTYVTAVAEAYRARNAPISRDTIRVVVRTAQYAEQVQNSLGPRAPTLLPTPFVEGLVLLPVFDSPTSFRFLNTEDLKTLGLTEQEVQQLALTNLRAALKLRPLMDVAKVAGRGRIGQLLGDSFYPSRLALFDTWAPLAKAQGGKLIVAAPATDAVLYVGDDSPTAIDALRTLARNLMTRVPHPLSEILLRWTPTGWDVVR
jgi:uncharacterized protein YtpQ (UPF0354 family)